MMDMGVRTVTLTKGYAALVDEEIYHTLILRKWFATRVERPYAGTHRIGTRNGIDLMHRILVGAQPGQYVDHINGNSLDNRLSNLRVCTNAENIRNMRVRPGTSRFKGVYLTKQRLPWRAQIEANYKKHNLGNFLTEEEAARAYDEAAIRLFGSFAKLNFQSEAV